MVPYCILKVHDIVLYLLQVDDSERKLRAEALFLSFLIYNDHIICYLLKVDDS